MFNQSFSKIKMEEEKWEPKTEGIKQILNIFYKYQSSTEDQKEIELVSFNIKEENTRVQ
jgi:hypothetical protein